MKPDIPLGDSAIPLSEAPSYLPKRRGRKVHYSTIYRWATKGTRGQVLRSELVGGVRYTSIAALREFFAGIKTAEPEQRSLDELRRVLYGDDAQGA